MKKIFFLLVALAVFIGTPVHAQVEMYPNPTDTRETISITTNESTITSIHFYDILGNDVSNKIATCSNTGRICTQDVSKLVSGVYVVKVHLKNGEYRSQKVIKL